MARELPKAVPLRLRHGCERKARRKFARFRRKHQQHNNPRGTPRRPNNKPSKGRSGARRTAILHALFQQTVLWQSAHVELSNTKHGPAKRKPVKSQTAGQMQNKAGTITGTYAPAERRVSPLLVASQEKAASQKPNKRQLKAGQMQCKTRAFAARIPGNCRPIQGRFMP